MSGVFCFLGFFWAKHILSSYISCYPARATCTERCHHLLTGEGKPEGPIILSHYPSLHLSSRVALEHGSSFLPTWIRWWFLLCRVLMLVQSCASYHLDDQAHCFHFQTYLKAGVAAPEGSLECGRFVLAVAKRTYYTHWADWGSSPIPVFISCAAALQHISKNSSVVSILCG